MTLVASQANAPPPEVPFRMPSSPSQPFTPSSIESLAALACSSIPGPRGALAASLLGCLHARTSAGYLARVPARSILEDAVLLLELIERGAEGFSVRIDVRRDEAGRERHVLESMGRDQPFILDSLLELLRTSGVATREVFHPIIAVTRDAKGRIATIQPARRGAELLSVVHIELQGTLDAEKREALRSEAESVLGEARLVCQDFAAMLERLSAVEEGLRSRAETMSDGNARDEWREAADFLNWLRRSNFVFLGYRAYEISGSEAALTLGVHPGSGLGILRDEARSSYHKPRLLASLPGDLRRRVLDPLPLLVHKTNVESRVLRRTRMDYIGVKRLDPAGKVIGEDRFLGLFTARAYNELPTDIPILRRKLDAILERWNIVPGSHDQREYFSVFTSLPKSELFVTDVEALGEMISSVVQSAGSRDVRVSYRPDLLERGFSVMVRLPREKFRSEVRVQIQDLLARAFSGTLIDYRLALSEEPMARLHFYFAVEKGSPPPPSPLELERQVADVVKTWGDRFREALEREHGVAVAGELHARFANAFPGAYVAQRGPETAVLDARHIDEAIRSGQMKVVLATSRARGGEERSVLKLFSPGEALALSTLMPVLANLDLTVFDEQSFRFQPGPLDGANGPAKEVPVIHLHAFHVLGPGGGVIPPGRARSILEGLLPALLRGEVTDDSLNCLVTRAELEARQIEVLRAYDAYLQQLGLPWTRRTKYGVLRDHPRVARLLVELFETRFDPGSDAREREALEAELRGRLRAAMEGIAGILEDAILRAFQGLILATQRTSYFLDRAQGLEGAPARPLALKLRSAMVERMPDPRPLYEIFVHGPAVEGIHLRSGKVSRGGIRWSSRPDDYRTEVLALMQTQRTKNAVIVPVGAKGGFVLKKAAQPPSPQEIRAGYESFIHALLDLTDNIVEGKLEHPPGVVVHDEEDPYFVVAADRGTATFSDVANGIATSRGFWLGDAFASGGSRGYDHKKEGITARGAWECARRHFRELGVDMDRETFTVAGIGDLSGDVFGNGLTYSGKLRLLAAFNHVHVFIDPDPDPEASLLERQRMFRLPRSSWKDYDASKISRGGGVFERAAKVIPLSPEARAVLGIEAAAVNGDELVRAVLRMPVDLLWNGGIGTYVKAESETHAAVGDQSNDAVRINAVELRAKIVAEGGNLGLTQLGRIEYARAGGRINTDAIDNSAGVDLSDHEVNLKILLAGAIRSGRLQEEERDAVLSAAGPEVCRQVLRDNYLQSQVLSLEERRGAAALDDHAALIDELCGKGLLDRSVERMPSDVELRRLRESRLGLTRPQMAILLAYAKIDAYEEIVASDIFSSVSGSPGELSTQRRAGSELDALLLGYFPAGVAVRFEESIREHVLRREIAATVAVNDAINHVGIGFFRRVTRRSGGSFATALRAYLAAWELARGHEVLQEVDRQYAAGSTPLEGLYAAQTAFRDALEVAVLGIVRRGAADVSSSNAVRRYADLVAAATPMPAPTGAWAPAGDPVAPAGGAKASTGGPDRFAGPLEEGVARARALARGLDLADLRHAHLTQLDRVNAAWEEASRRLRVDDIEDAASRMPLASGDEIEMRVSLLAALGAHRLRLARILIEGSWSPEGAGVQAGESPHRRSLDGRLAEARSRDALAPSRLYGLVELAGRLVDDVASRAG